MAKEMPSYKNRIDRICNKVQRMVSELESNKKSISMGQEAKKTLNEVVQNILTDQEEVSDV